MWSAAAIWCQLTQPNNLIYVYQSTKCITCQQRRDRILEYNYIQLHDVVGMNGTHEALEDFLASSTKAKCNMTTETIEVMTPSQSKEEGEEIDLTNDDNETESKCTGMMTIKRFLLHLPELFWINVQDHNLKF